MDSAQIVLNEANSNVKITTIKEKITKKNVNQLIKNPDLIIDCLDNFSTRHIINRFSVSNQIPLIHSGVSGFHGQITFLNPPETACLACFIPEKTKKEIVPVMGATPGVIGAMQATEAIKYLTGIGSNLKNRLLFYNGLDMNFETINLVKNPRCKVCGKKR